MKNFLVGVSNTVGFVLGILGIILAFLIGTPLVFLLWLATRFIVDQNGTRKYTGAEDFLNAVVSKLQGYTKK